MFVNAGRRRRCRALMVMYFAHRDSTMASASATQANMRVLLVEDERKVASFIARALREDAYAVDLAENGQMALEFAVDRVYDAILLDVRLPGLSGIEVCSELREQGIETPILMLTARTLVEQRVEGLDAGADDYLTKPFALAELRARVRARVQQERPQAAICRPGTGSPSPSRQTREQ
jgi:DNA-binding response OmpR family regulator